MMTTPQTPTSRRGFTAIELTAVASIIALLALILLPVVRNRLEQARIAAATDDMRSIEIAESLAQADTTFLFRLADLDQAGPDFPPVQWNGGFLNPNAGTLLAEGWMGPYMTFNREKSEITTLLWNSPIGPELFRTFNIDTLSFENGEGPMVLVTSNSFPQFDDLSGNPNQRWPIDPWGSPYLFFGPGPISLASFNGDSNVPSLPNGETNFGDAAIFSLGPDGLPGTAADPVAENFYRETGIIGRLGTDDLVRTF